MFVTRKEYDPAYHYREHPGDRWVFRPVFVFSDNRPEWRGGWNPADRFEDSAAAVNKDNLLVAYIEGKHFTTKEVKYFADCPGHEFKTFQRLVVMISNQAKSMEHVYGMKLVAKSYSMIALENGSIRHEHNKDDASDNERDGISGRTLPEN